MSDTKQAAQGDRPQRRRRGDLTGLHSIWWMAVLWLIVIALVVFPFPWWW